MTELSTADIALLRTYLNSLEQWIEVKNFVDNVLLRPDVAEITIEEDSVYDDENYHQEVVSFEGTNISVDDYLNKDGVPNKSIRSALYSLPIIGSTYNNWQRELKPTLASDLREKLLGVLND